MAERLPISFRSGLSLGPDGCRVVAQIDELMDAGEIDTEIYRWKRGSGWSSSSLDWIASRSTFDPRIGGFITLGLEGQVDLEVGDQHTLEYMDRLSDGRRGFGGFLRDIRVIGNDLFAVGMGRQIHRRAGDGRWIREDEGTRQTVGDLAVAGFNAVDGIDSHNLYAAGFNGEIWHRRLGAWYRADSPTNVVLHRLRAVSPDLVYACGQQGVLIAGNHDRWKFIEHTINVDNFWGMEWFNGKLYLADNDCIYVLDEREDLKALDLDLGPFTFGDLHADHGALWSFGAKHLAVTTDGIHWEDMTPRGDSRSRQA
jgi:hypothetical protein